MALHERETRDRGAGEGLETAVSEVQPVSQGTEVHMAPPLKNWVVNELRASSLETP